MTGDELPDPVGSRHQLAVGPFLNKSQVLINGAVRIRIDFYTAKIAANQW